MALLGALLTGACSADPVDPDLESEEAELCSVTDLGGSKFRYSFDGATGRLVTDTYTFDIDRDARTIDVSGNELTGPVWYWRETFDSHGHRTRLDDRGGTRWIYENEYVSDRLTSVVLHDPAAGRIKTVYDYDDPENPSLWTRQEITEVSTGTAGAHWVRTLADGHPERAEFHSLNETLDSVWTYAYENARVVKIERDRGYWEQADGTFDIRYSWSYDATGRITSFAQDGVDSFDNPHIDGEPDVEQTFSPGCGALLSAFPWIAHVPDQNDIGPGYRSPTIFPTL